MAVSAHAANHYVRAGAAGSASGSDWTNAYATLPAALTRGDVYYIADGSYSSYNFDDPVSGTQLITVKKATLTDHGTDTGWQTTYGDGTASFVSSIAFLTGYYVFDGQARTGPTSGHGFKIDNSASGSTELVQFGQFGVPISNVTIKYTAIVGRGYGQASVFDRAFYSNSPGTSNITLQYNSVVGVYVPLVTRNLDTMLVEYNTFADNNSRPESHAETWSDSGTDNVIFRFNQIKNPEGSASIFIGNGGGTSPNNSNTSTNWQIYGNVWFYSGYVTAPGNNPGTAGIIYVANDSSNRNWADGWVFYNNTIHDFSHGTESGRIFVENINGVTAPLVRNNLWNNCSDGAGHLNITASHNYYRGTTHSAESNEQIGTSDPFVSVSAGNFHLAAVTNAGLTLSSPFNTDADGHVRGADGVWDRGAYEFVSGAPPPPPSGSPCDVNSDGSTNVSDVQLCVNQAIGAAPCTTADINQDGSCNVIDVQRVVNAALGGQCVTQ